MRRLVWGALGVFGALVLAGTVLEALAWNGSAQVRALTVDSPLTGLATLPALLAGPVVGALIATRRPGHPVGWLLLATGVAAAWGWFTHSYGMYGLVGYPGSLPAAGVVTSLGQLSWLAFALPITLLPLWFPDGHPPGRRWRAVGWLAAAGMLIGSVGTVLAPGRLQDGPPLDNPLGMESPAGLFAAVRDGGLALVLLAAVLAVTSLLVRYRRADQVSRQQLKWLFWTAAVLIVLVLVANLAPGLRYGENAAVGLVVDALLQVGLPVAVAIAILRHRLYDIDLLIRRSVVYGALWALITVAYAVAAWTLGVAASGRLPIEVAVLLAVVVTLVFQPLRRRLDRLADRLVFGHRPSGYALVADLGSAIGEIGAPEQLAVRVAALVRHGLDLEWTRVVLAESGAVAVDGPANSVGEPQLAVPLRYGEEQVGTVECGPSRERPLSTADREVLDAITTQAGLAVHDLRLTAELRQRLEQVRDQSAELAASRARIVAAQEGERRRIERNLHDGAQQELVALIAKTRLARVQLHREPEQAEATLTELQRDAQLALAGLRELAQGIHPTVLADKGLVEAIEDRTARLPITVTVHADPPVRRSRFADAIEGAAFFAVSEALANVLKHAHTDQADVRLWHEDGVLRLEVADRGRGFAPDTVDSIGLPRLADRIEALGGSLRVRSSAGTGTVLSARLPARPREHHNGG